jgi:hypothetical protein
MSYKVLNNTEFILIDEDIYRFNKTLNDWTLIQENKDSKHRLQINCDGKLFFYYRVKYWLANEDFDIFDTKCQIDHINVDVKDNRLSNLRPCTNKQNCRNRATYRGKLTKGWSYVNRKKPYKAYVNIENGKKKSKYFHTEIEAHNWYLENRPRF